MQTSLRLFLYSFSVIFLIACGGVIPVPPQNLPISTITPIIQAQNTVTAQPTAETKDRVYDITISRDKQNLAVLTSKGIYIYDSVTLTQKQFIEVKTKVSQQNFHLLSPSVTFTPDGSKLIFSSENWILSWDLIDNKENDNLYLSQSVIPTWNISKIEYSPKGDRVMVTTYGNYTNCEGTGINFALYDTGFNLLFDRYFCTAVLESYYRFSSDNKVYIFYNYQSMFFPLQLYIVDLTTGNLLTKETHNMYSDSPQNFIYDISQNGNVFAIGNYDKGKLTTRLVDNTTGQTLQEISGGIDFSLDGIGKLRKSNLNEIVNEKCRITNKPNEGKQYTMLTSNDVNAIFTVSDWYSSADWENVKSIELLNLSSCKIEKTITFP